MDSFKGSLTSAEANEAVLDALKECGFDDVRCFTMSDGGEGFCAAVSQYVEAEEVTAKVHGPLGSIVCARYLVADGVAYIESASVCGYGQISDGDRNPFMLSSRGLGELLLDASGRGVKKIVVGLGGTCTLDAGIGMLQALGARFAGGERLLDPITSADFSGMAPLCPVEVWYDTAAPMCGENGPVMLFGRQKGLEEGQMPAAEAWMGQVSQLYSKARGVDAANLPGAGAAGGIGGALAAVLGADMFPGGRKVVELSGMRQFIIESGDALEAVVTGEGHFDAQTLTGKLPAVVAMTARDAASNRPLIVCAAGIADDLQQDLFDKVLSISEGAGQLQESMRKPAAMKNLKASVKLAMR
ncbi:MAG: glycerate kinase [Bacteroidales bacterium]|nr:glycerate kinase [Bacteroidales bacterium]